MKFTLVHENKLKVVLSAADMESLVIDYESMDYNDPATREVLLELLEQSRERVGFNPRKSKLFIEVYPCEGGGCVLYFTCLPGGGGARKTAMIPVLFEFDSVEDLVTGACGAYDRYRQRILRSSLYLLEGRYRLVVYPLDYSDRLSEYFLCEYGNRVGEGELAVALTEEHGEELVRDEAIETLAYYFGDSGADLQC